MKEEVKTFNEKAIWKMGADAYMAGKKIIDNPFHKDSQEAKAWDYAFRCEHDFWDFRT